MIFTVLFLFQSVGFYSSVTKQAILDLNQYTYDSLRVSANWSRFEGGKWINTKPLRPGNNLLKIKFPDRYRMIPIKIQIFRKVFRTKDYIRRSEKIDPVNLQTRTEDITFISDPILEIDALYASRSLKAGAVLTAQNTRKAFDCHFGDKVTLLYKNESLTIRMDAKAMEDAFIGEKIRIQMISTGKKMRAILVDKGVIRYDEG